MVSDMPLMYGSGCGRRRCVVVSFGSSSRSVSVTLDEVFVVVVP